MMLFFGKNLKKGLDRYVRNEYEKEERHDYSAESLSRLKDLLASPAGFTAEAGQTAETEGGFSMKKTRTGLRVAAVVCALVVVLSAAAYAVPAVREYLNMAFLKKDGGIGRLTEVPEGWIGVYTAEDLDRVRDDPTGWYILMNDIVFTEADFAPGGRFEGGFVPIGSGSGGFAGIFNGNGHVIRGLKIDGDYPCAGLFADVRFTLNEDGVRLTEDRKQMIRGAVIKNLGLEDSTIRTTSEGREYEHTVYAGGIAGYAEVVAGCYTKNVTVTVTGGGDRLIALGGIAGETLYVDSCWSDAKLTLSGDVIPETCRIGGITGSAIYCVTSYFDGSFDCGDRTVFPVAGCDYHQPMCLSEGAMDEILRRLDGRTENDPAPFTVTRDEKTNGIIAIDDDLGSPKAKMFWVYFAVLPWQSSENNAENYVVPSSAGDVIFDLDPTLPYFSEYMRVQNLLDSVYTSEELEDFCERYGIRLGAKYLYDLRGNAECSFEGFDFVSIWVRKEKPELRIFQ